MEHDSKTMQDRIKSCLDLEETMGAHEGGFQEVFSSSASEVLNQKEDAISPEDLAWVESCLVKDLGHADDNWDDMKDALWNIISSQEPSPFDVSYKTLEITNDYVQINDESAMTPLGDFMQDSLSPNHAPVKENRDDESDMAGLFGQHLSYNFINSDESEDGEAKMDAVTIVDTESLESIFKVWDLGTQFEVDELAEQFTTALAAKSSVGNDLHGAALDDLLTGIADLSLHTRT
ncbi:hypothetical protein MRB53_033197 [Persea americana]|uniref:Uncharacterized protein n=1 Tax=Persea americana TaxID=3435 RepID=A0ACC2KU96_PERAE|nr:hypothetical protein MRB53_033197 [Persea americana]|eukprot:TRINITY_DN27779_c0_g1_i1.p1 TRINITY_DN27779_c0_g1~~TRINITY_DN27779_c0_g1_i1.p1  ORF type:complete len:234 (+),score=62.29 TRINITY_DN27779_c0_g1_i1:207-908(+)